MPRKFKLTWQPGFDGRANRWMKIYRGERHYFPGGRGKYDREAYEAALDAWDETKREIDANAPKPHQADYEKAIDEWETVLAWCRKYGGEDEMAEVAEKKLAVLGKGLSAARPKPINRADTLDGHLDVSARYDKALGKTKGLSDAVSKVDGLTAISPLAASDQLAAAIGELVDEASKRLQTIDKTIDADTGNLKDASLKTPSDIWHDRLDVMQRSAVPPDLTVEANVERFLQEKAANVASGELSQGRLYKLRSHLNEFMDWLGRDTAVADIDSNKLSDYRLDLLRRVEAKECKRQTAKDRLVSVKSFVKWLWQIEAISSLPRILDTLQIGTEPPKIVVFAKDEIANLLSDAADRTKLYVLLMLNCGMTQKDIADLLEAQVDWDVGRITRKRSKTEKHENVPTVSYLLWPETLRLLRQEKTDLDSERVLLNKSGRPLWHEETTADGKYKRSDNIKSAFFRLCKKTGIDKPLISLKKTSASLLRDNERFTGLASLFLGHAPQSMADKHYARVPQELFDDAIQWLGKELGIIEDNDTVEDDQAEADQA